MRGAVDRLGNELDTLASEAELRDRILGAEREVQIFKERYRQDFENLASDEVTMLAQNAAGVRVGAWRGERLSF